MIYEKIRLDENDETVFLEVYAPDKIDGFTRDAILVIPGGAYAQVCHDREGEPIAMAFLPYGFASFVLHYSVKEECVFPMQLIQASKAMKHIRDNAEKYGINPERVFAVGFSAGGHLAGSLGNLWNLEEVTKAVGGELGCNKPTGTMLIYPVVSGDEKFSHLWTLRNLFGVEEPTKEMRHQFSLDKHIGEHSSPAFIFHTVADQSVNVENSISLISAYNKAGVMYEAHIFPNGPHGMALANEITEIGNPEYVDEAMSKWIELAVLWSKKIK